MGDNTLVARTNGQTIVESFFNDIRTAMIGTVVPRNASGVAAAASGSLGSTTYDWLASYIRTMYFGTTADDCSFSVDGSGDIIISRNGLQVGKLDANGITLGTIPDNLITPAKLNNSTEGEVFLYGGNGAGSSYTKIRRFSTESVNTGSAITYADSAANGATFTINQAGKYGIVYQEYDSTNAPTCGITVNESGAFTQNVNNMSVPTVIAFGSCDITAVPANATFIGNLAENDVIRAHIGGHTADSDSDSSFRIIRIIP